MNRQAVSDVLSASRNLAIGTCLYVRWQWMDIWRMPEVREGAFVLLAILGLMSFMALVAPQ